jgi:hypothetical protein
MEKINKFIKQKYKTIMNEQLIGLGNVEFCTLFCSKFFSRIQKYILK